jgi:GAF domain-containing protein/anti-sigma regulatory factor (Ser/Thr protein kinase)
MGTLRAAKGRGKARPPARGNRRASDPLKRALAERDQALRFQAATGEILASMRSSVTDAQPVFRTIVDNVLRLFGTRYAAVFLIRDDNLELAAARADADFERRQSSAFRKFRESFPQRVDYSGFTGKALLSGRVMQMVPVVGNPEATPQAVALAKSFGYDSLVVAPLMCDGRAIGVIGTTHPQARRFEDGELALFRAFADQGVIAIENVRLFKELQGTNANLREALEQQTATAEILRAISGATTDVQPVFDTIVRNAAALCNGLFANAFRYDGELLHFAATSSTSAEARKLLSETYPVRPGKEQISGRTILAKTVVRMEDALADADYDRRHAMAGDWRRMLGVPMLRDGQPIGAIVVAWPDPRPIPKAQEELLKTFADQAVIAIENVRLFKELEARNKDLGEALEQQTATAEILRVISSSPADIQPVFDSILEHAMRLCDAGLGTVGLYDGKHYRHVAQRGGSPEYVTFLFGGAFEPDPDSTIGRVIAERRPLHVPDYREIAAYRDRRPRAVATVELGGARTFLAVPMLKEGRAIGAMTIRRAEVRPFTPRQIELVTTFANQAVIAIENARLFNETKEALEQQKASAEVLGAISGSIADTKPVFDKILASCERLFEGQLVGVTLAEGDAVRLVAYRGPDSEELKKVYPLPLTHESGTGWAILNAEIAHFPDIEAAGVPPGVVAGCRTLRVRAIVFAPMLFEGRGIGAIWVARRLPGAFSEKQLAQLSTFADQAVIAIQNARLFNETKEALEQQTATAQVLSAISGSPTDVRPVYEAILDNATLLCDASFAGLFLYDGEYLRIAAQRGAGPELAKFLNETALPPSRDTTMRRAALEKRIVQVDDFQNDPGFKPADAHRAENARAVLAVPMLRKGALVGVVTVWRREPRRFTEKQVALLKTFADQAVIAIENARLFNETSEALDQQKASAEVLRVISSSVADTEPVFEIILRSCERLFAGLNVGINVVGDDGAVHIAAYHGRGRAELERLPVPLSEASGSGAAILRRTVVHYPDVEAPGVPDYARRGGAIAGNKSVIFAPMLWEQQAIGAIFVGRDFTGPFTEKEIALLRTFADQAVIAIQNARLFREIQEKSSQLEVANKHKSDFLANMSHELRTPLNAIIGFSEVLMERMFGEVNEKQADYLKDIHESGRHLLSLINDILDLSKIEAGRMELELSSFHLPTAISNAMTLVRERAQRHGIELGLDVDPRLGEFQGDERKMKQILLNLLSNAVKFTPDGGRVDVSARPVDSRLEIAVKDSGVGIAPEDQAALFEEFRQVGGDASRRAEGTGLGLALTRRFVELHGGEIRLESAPGKGSTFTITLPLRQ